MEDDHVDRPGVEAQQCVKLTGTNSSIGLIVLIGNAHRTLFDDAIFLSWCAKALRTGRPTMPTRFSAVWLPCLTSSLAALQNASSSPRVWCAVCSVAIEDRGSAKTEDQDVFKKKTGEGLPASQMLRFADLVVIAGRLHPFPFRTRP